MRRSCGTRASLMSCSSSSRLNTAPALLTVANAAELEMRQDARLVAAQSGDLRVAEECAQDGVNVPHGARSEFFRSYLRDHVGDVPRLHLLEPHRSDRRVDVRLEPALVVVDGPDAELAPLLQEALAERPDRRGRARRLGELGTGVGASLR